MANVISNCNIRFLILCGVESKGHLPGNTILALHRNGIDEQGRIIGSKGAIPFIQNLPPEAIQRFQEQVELIDCIGLEDIEQIEELISRYSRLCEPYPARALPGNKKKGRIARDCVLREGDLFFGAGVVMDTSAWLVIEVAEALAEAWQRDDNCFDSSREQSIVNVAGVKFGGQPGELPSVLCGTIFYHGHKIVEDEERGLFDRTAAERLISRQAELSEETGCPCCFAPLCSQHSGF